MSIFEYIMVMVSLILALTMAQGLRGLSETVRSPHQYLPHTMWIVLVVLLVIQTWWAYWDLNRIEQWTVVKYVSVLVMPIFLFTLAYMLVPATRTAETNWDEYYYATKQWFFGIMILVTLTAISVNMFLFDTPFLHPNRAFQVLYIISSIIGLSTSNRLVHAALPWAYLLVLVINQIVVRMQIGAML